MPQLLVARFTTITPSIDLVLNGIGWLDNLGKRSRSHKNTKLENFLTEMQRMTLIHEQGEDGGEYYRFAPGASKAPGDDEDEPRKTKGANTQKTKNQAKLDSKKPDSVDASGADRSTKTDTKKDV